MLARLGMDAEQCTSANEDISRGVYGNGSSKTACLENVELSTTLNPLKDTSGSGGELSLSTACVPPDSPTQSPPPPLPEGDGGLSNKTIWKDEKREKSVCPIPNCGRVFQHLNAHMLTHLNVRSKKCPIDTCKYEAKGFVQEYGKGRHTLTHLQGPNAPQSRSAVREPNAIQPSVTILRDANNTLAQEFITDQVFKEVLSHDCHAFTQFADVFQDNVLARVFANANMSLSWNNMQWNKELMEGISLDLEQVQLLCSVLRRKPLTKHR